MTKMSFAIVGFILAASAVTQAMSAPTDFPTIVGSFRASTDTPSVIKHEHSYFLDQRDSDTPKKVRQLKKAGYACRNLRGPFYDGVQCEKHLVGTKLTAVPEWTYKSEKERFEGVEVTLSAPTRVLEAIVSIDGRDKKWLVSQNVSMHLNSGRLNFKKVLYVQWNNGPVSVSFGSWPYESMSANEYEFEFANRNLQFIWTKATNWYYAPESNYYKFGIPLQRTN